MELKERLSPLSAARLPADVIFKRNRTGMFSKAVVLRFVVLVGDQLRLSKTQHGHAKTITLGRHPNVTAGRRHGKYYGIDLGAPSHRTLAVLTHAEQTQWVAALNDAIVQYTK
jgi:hypothetical protein